MAALATDNSAQESNKSANKMCSQLFPCTLSSTRGMVCRNQAANKGGDSDSAQYFVCIVMKHVMHLIPLNKTCAQ